jgi:hypothetical protein
MSTRASNYSVDISSERLLDASHPASKLNSIPPSIEDVVDQPIAAATSASIPAIKVCSRTEAFERWKY